MSWWKDVLVKCNGHLPNGQPCSETRRGMQTLRETRCWLKHVRGWSHKGSKDYCRFCTIKRRQKNG